MSWFCSGNVGTETHIISLVKVNKTWGHAQIVWGERNPKRTKSNVETRLSRRVHKHVRQMKQLAAESGLLQWCNTV